LLKAAAATLLFAVPATTSAQAYQCRPPDRIEAPRQVQPDGPTRRTQISRYTLAASWSPEFCRSDRASMQCSGRNGRFGFVLHGLWPEARFGPAPQWCSLRPRPSPELIRRNLCMTPVPWLLEHEWAKHGSCMTKTPQAYFRTAAILWRSLHWPDADKLSRKDGLTAGDLRDTFLLHNRDWRRDQIGVVLGRSGWLREVHLCYGRNFMPERCPRGALGAADGAPLKIWRGV
jgi:ribonuclease T2